MLYPNMPCHGFQIGVPAFARIRNALLQIPRRNPVVVGETHKFLRHIVEQKTRSERRSFALSFQRNFDARLGFTFRLLKVQPARIVCNGQRRDLLSFYFHRDLAAEHLRRAPIDGESRVRTYFDRLAQRPVDRRRIEFFLRTSNS